MSTPPLTVCRSGSVNCSVGSMTDTFGKSSGLDMEVLNSLSGLDTTAMSFTSLEVADAVRTPKIGRAFCTSAFFSKKSHTSPS